MRSEQYYKIDPQLLREQFKVRNLPLTKSSCELGYSHAWLSNTIREGRISVVGAKLLQATYNIQPESYVIQEKPKEEEKEPGKYGIDEKKLYSIIYGAVYQAMKRALSE